MSIKNSGGAAVIVDTGRRRRTFSAAFKAEAIECCLQLGVSIAAVARAYELHPNLLRRWVVVHQQERQRVEGKGAALREEIPVSSASPADAITAAFVPVERTPAVAALSAPQAPSAASGLVRIELRSNARRITLHWPTAEPQALALWVREVLA